MNDLITLDEASTAPVKKGKRWYVTIARPGKGTSGEYPEHVLKESGPKAFPSGTKVFFKHNKTEDRDPRDQVGYIKEGAFWNEEEGELGAYLTPFARYAPVLEEAYDDETGQSYIEASIHAAARKDAKGTVRELVFRRDNTVDLVAFAGLEGSGLKYQVESLFAAAAADGENGKEEENNVEIEKVIESLRNELNSKLDAFAAKFDTFVAESKQELQGAVDAEALEAAVEARVEEALSTLAEVEKSIDDADIPTAVKESLKAAARKGEDITDNLAGAVSIVAEAKKEFDATNSNPKGARRGTVVVVEESADSKPKNFKVGRWSN
jgi:hypothetical protein